MPNDESFFYTPACRSSDIIYEGSDAEETPDEIHAKRNRYEEHAIQVAQGNLPTLITASLKGPFDSRSGWQNPWGTKSKRQSKVSQEDPCPKFSHGTIFPVQKRALKKVADQGLGYMTPSTAIAWCQAITDVEISATSRSLGSSNSATTKELILSSRSIGRDSLSDISVCPALPSISRSTATSQPKADGSYSKTRRSPRNSERANKTFTPRLPSWEANSMQSPTPGLGAQHQRKSSKKWRSRFAETLYSRNIQPQTEGLNGFKSPIIAGKNQASSSYPPPPQDRRGRKSRVSRERTLKTLSPEEGRSHLKPSIMLQSSEKEAWKPRAIDFTEASEVSAIAELEASSMSVASSYPRRVNSRAQLRTKIDCASSQKLASEISFITEVAPSCRDLEKFEFKKRKKAFNPELIGWYSPPEHQLNYNQTNTKISAVDIEPFNVGRSLLEDSKEVRDDRDPKVEISTRNEQRLGGGWEPISADNETSKDGFVVGEVVQLSKAEPVSIFGASRRSSVQVEESGNDLETTFGVGCSSPETSAIATNQAATVLDASHSTTTSPSSLEIIDNGLSARSKFGESSNPISLAPPVAMVLGLNPIRSNDISASNYGLPQACHSNLDPHQARECSPQKEVNEDGKNDANTKPINSTPTKSSETKAFPKLREEQDLSHDDGANSQPNETDTEWLEASDFVSPSRTRHDLLKLEPPETSTFVVEAMEKSQKASSSPQISTTIAFGEVINSSRPNEGQSADNSIWAPDMPCVPETIKAYSPPPADDYQLPQNTAFPSPLEDHMPPCRNSSSPRICVDNGAFCQSILTPENTRPQRLPISQSPWCAEDLLKPSPNKTFCREQAAESNDASVFAGNEKNEATQIEWQPLKPPHVIEEINMSPLFNFATPIRPTAVETASGKEHSSTEPCSDNPWISSTFKKISTQKRKKKVSFGFAQAKDENQEPQSAISAESQVSSKRSCSDLDWVDNGQDLTARRKVSLPSTLRGCFNTTRPFKRILPDKNASQYDSSPAPVSAMAEAFLTADADLQHPRRKYQSPHPKHNLSLWEDDEVTVDNQERQNHTNESVAPYDPMTDFDINSAIEDANVFLEDWSVEGELKKSRESAAEFESNGIKRRRLFGLV